MGKGYENYMSKKWFHPTNLENMKRIWMAEQKNIAEKTKDDEMRQQYEREQELYHNKTLMGDEKAKLGLSFMYNAPLSLNDQKQQESGPDGVKFEWQRKVPAPRESFAKDNEQITDQPFGIEVRNVRCIKCKKWGHINTDKVCPMNRSRLDMANSNGPGPQFNPKDLIEDLKNDGFVLKPMAAHLIQVPKHILEEEEKEEDQDDPELDFLKSLSKKEKKRLWKKLKRLDKKLKRDIIPAIAATTSAAAVTKAKEIKIKQEPQSSESSSSESEEEEEKIEASKKKRLEPEGPALPPVKEKAKDSGCESDERPRKEAHKPKKEKPKAYGSDSDGDRHRHRKRRHRSSSEDSPRERRRKESRSSGHKSKHTKSRRHHDSDSD